MSEEVILEKFYAWTKKLRSKEARIAVFEHIRDIPYAIVPELRDPYHGPDKLLKLNRGPCQAKHYLLGRLFVRLGIPVQYATYSFGWNSSFIKYPQDLKKVVEGLPLAYHLACKAHINDKWILVDATWDLPLRKAGFRVNEKWDGVNDTMNAVVPVEEVDHASIAERFRYETERRSSHSEKEKANYAQFIDKFNIWLESLRKG
ncbi:MAG: hypothetical protein Q8O30_05575 [Candidatus Omnitrophota bacterium]|nr:hypothetical protein [Candidatus Omnitrophota bacterium]